jgi:hypothetical protein
MSQLNPKFTARYENTIKPLFDLSLMISEALSMGKGAEDAPFLQGLVTHKLNGNPRLKQFVPQPSQLNREVPMTALKSPTAPPVSCIATPLPLDNILEFLPRLLSISSMSGTIATENFRVYVINDFYKLPATIGRIVCPSVSMSIVEETKASHRIVPSLAFGCGVGEADEVIDASQQVLAVSLNLRLGVDYQNPSLIAWEPMLEARTHTWHNLTHTWHNLTRNRHLRLLR